MAAPAELETVKLISGDGHEFFVEKRCAMVSGTIRAMLEGPYVEREKMECTFPEISSAMLELVVSYMCYKTKYTNSKVPIEAFPIDPAVALELLMVASFLDV